jgi:hypothetical protein
MGEEGKRRGDKAFLLLTFDLDRQEMLSTEELTGHFEVDRHQVSVDWVRLLTTIKRGKNNGSPQDPPWTDALTDEDYRPPLWHREGDETDGEQNPPKI